MNKYIAITLFILCLGCRTKTKAVDSKIEELKIEEVAKIEEKTEKIVIKDSIFEKKKVDVKKESSIGLKVEYEPKVGDSLEVKYQIGKDSLFLKVNGNGKISFDYKTFSDNTISEIKEILSSKTLYNIDSVVKSQHKIKAKLKAIEKTKKVKEVAPSFGIYIIIGGAVLFAIGLFWFFGMPKKNKFKI